MAAQIVPRLSSKTCKKCGTVFSVQRCPACAKKRFASYYSRPEFREKVKGLVKRWQSKNADKVKGFKHKWRQSNKEYMARYKKEYTSKRRQEINAATRRNYWANVGACRDKARTHREKNRERRKELRRLQYRKDVEYSRAQGRYHAFLRRTRTIISSARFTESAWIEKCAFWGWRCYLCGVELTLGTATLDHRIPVAKNGPHMLSNLAPACHRCNCSKRHRTESEYRRWLRSCKLPMMGIFRSSRCVFESPLLCRGPSRKK